MANQTSVEARDGREEAPAAVFARNFSDCARDIVSLAELQSRLLSLDLKQVVRQAAVPAALAGTALAVLLGSVPIMLMTIAYALVDVAGWSRWAAFLLATVIGLILGSGLAAGAYAIFRNSFNALDRSRKELADNLRWLKEALSVSGRLRHRSQCP
jgi:hypothetical protein